MTRHIPGQFTRNILQVKKKYGENRPSINLKTLNKFIPYNILKSKICIAWNTFLGKTIFSAGSKKYLFLRTTVHEFKKICEIRLVGKSLWVSLPLFWSRACSQDVSKTVESTNSSVEVVKHSSSDISRQYFCDEKDVRGNFNEHRHTERFFASRSVFSYKSEKISSETIPANGIFSSKNGYLWN